MQIQEETQEDLRILTISDHLDTMTAQPFETRLLGLIDDGARKVLVDCSPLEYVNSAGLTVFLLAAKKIEALGGKLVLCALAPSVLMIFEMIGFTRIMTIVPTRQQGIDALRGGAKAE